MRKKALPSRKNDKTTTDALGFDEQFNHHLCFRTSTGGTTYGQFVSSLSSLNSCLKLPSDGWWLGYLFSTHLQSAPSQATSRHYIKERDRSLRREGPQRFVLLFLLEDSQLYTTFLTLTYACTDSFCYKSIITYIFMLS